MLQRKSDFCTASIGAPQLGPARAKTPVRPPRDHGGERLGEGVAGAGEALWGSASPWACFRPPESPFASFSLCPASASFERHQISLLNRCARSSEQHGQISRLLKPPDV